ncbi:hypothetical protein FHG87_019889 [Trinorchestia longiramus]|nr:hypothetical protein FHG87_019889 [Trinorchestia longiramus]
MRVYHLATRDTRSFNLFQAPLQPALQFPLLEMETVAGSILASLKIQSNRSTFRKKGRQNSPRDSFAGSGPLISSWRVEWTESKLMKKE